MKAQTALPLRVARRRDRRLGHPTAARFTKRLIAILGCLGILACNSPAGKNHYILADRLFSDHKYAAAVDEFKKIVESDPRSTLAQKALFRIGTIHYLYLERYEDAIKSFRQFIALSDDRDLIYQAEKSIGDIYFSKLEDYRQASAEYSSILEKNPDSPDKEFFLLRVARSYYGALDFARAIEVYRDVAKRFPKSAAAAEARYQIGNTYYTKGDVDEAIDAFQDVILSYPGTQQAVFAEFGIGNCYEEKGKLDEALEIYTKILDKHPARSVVEAKIRRLKERKIRSH